MNSLRTLFLWLAVTSLVAGCATTSRQASPQAGQRIAFLGITAAPGQQVPEALRDSAAIEGQLRQACPSMTWVGDAALNLPLREVLKGPWPPVDAWISGTCETGQILRVIWSWTEASRVDRPMVIDATYPSPTNAETFARSVAESFGLVQPPAAANSVPLDEQPHGADPSVISVQDKTVKVSGKGLKKGRYFIRGQPEFVENPITGEKSQVSAGAVRGLLEIDTVENGTATGRLLDGQGAPGDRLEKAE
jgi:hypothetical protein